MKLIEAEINNYRPHSRNVMPSAINKFIGPFIYFDHLGPYDFPAGGEVYIPPHPHAGIATISYMFNGEGNHKDSLGSEQILHQGRLNYMNSGNGIIHSEGLSKEFTKSGGKLLGVQIWHLLSENERNNKAVFNSFNTKELKSIDLNENCKSVILLGNYNLTFSPVDTEREMLLMTIEGKENNSTAIQLKQNWQYLLYCCEGVVQIDNLRLQTGKGIFIDETTELIMNFIHETKAILFGGPIMNEEPIFYGSLAAVGFEQMQSYQLSLKNGEFGILEQ